MPQVTDSVKQHLYQDMRQAAWEMMEEQGCVHVDALHDHLAEQFGDRLAKYRKRLKQSNRKESDNLIDWVKANLTKEGWRFGSYYIPLPACGKVNGTQLANYEEACRFIVKVQTYWTS